jgi:hypothetical protein
MKITHPAGLSSYRTARPVLFFGRMTLAAPIAAIIARRIGVRVWMARCLRVGSDSRFRIDIKELRVPRTANQADDVRCALNATANSKIGSARSPASGFGATGFGVELEWRALNRPPHRRVHPSDFACLLFAAEKIGDWQRL